MQRIALFAAGLGILVSGCSVYAPSARSGARSAHVAAPSASPGLSAADAAVIRSYLADNHPGTGPGRGRNGGLPPGIEKNLQRGKPLPPGIAKQHLPGDLLLRLPPAADGFEYVVVAGKLLLVEIATQIVRDVLLDAVLD